MQTLAWMNAGNDAIETLVDASASVLEMPIAPEYRAAVIAVMRRIAGFAADVTAFPLADDVETAAVFTP